MKINKVFQQSMFIGILITAFAMATACKKQKPVKGNGSDSIIYESYLTTVHKFRPFDFGYTFDIENVNVYQDMLGQVAINAHGGFTDGKENWVKELVISNLKLSSYLSIKLTSTDNYDLGQYLTDCQLIYQYYPINNSGKKTEVLATFINYNAYEGEVTMNPTSKDLTKLFKGNDDGRLLINFKFSQTGDANDYVYLKYSIPFDYNYSYTYTESK